MSVRTLFIGVKVQKTDISYVERAYEAPSVFDYDIVIMDMDSVFPDNWKSSIPNDGYADTNQAEGFRFQRQARKFAKEVSLLLGKGGVLVCLMRPKRGVRWDWLSMSKRETELENNYNWIPIESLSHYVESGSGKRIALVDDLSPFGRYINMPETHWTAYFENLRESEARYSIIATNDAGLPVAVQAVIGNGRIFFLPLSSHTRAGDIVLESATRSFRKTRERTPPSWMMNMKVPTEDADAQSLSALAAKVFELKTEYDDALRAFEKKTEIKKLLYEKDEALRETVKTAFEELGFTLTQKGDMDWIATSGIGEAILEVTGSDGSIDIDKFRQLLNYLIDEYKETGVEKKAILVANHFAGDPLEVRGDPFTEKAIAESKVHSICLLSTIELFKAVCSLREGKAEGHIIRSRIMEAAAVANLA